MKLLHCVSQDNEALANILASAPRVVSEYRANGPDHLSGPLQNGNRKWAGDETKRATAPLNSVNASVTSQQASGLINENTVRLLAAH